MEDGRDENELVNYYRDSIIFSNDMLHITIIPTDSCNFKCRYCYQSEEVHFMADQDIEAVIMFFKKTVPKFNSVYISWFGGEPLMAADTVLKIMVSVCAICRENHVPLYSQMTTNGYNLTPELFSKLISHHILWYMVTIDGIEETHNFQRPHKTNQDSFQRVLSNLIHIRDQVKRKNFRIGIRINISPLIVPHLREFVDMIAKEFANDSRYALTWEWVKDWGGERISENNNLIIKSLEDSHFADFNEYLLQKGVALERGQAMTNLGSELCMAYRKNGFTINYDTKLYKCPMILYNKEYNDINEVGYIDQNGKMIIDDAKNSKWVGASAAAEGCKDCLQYPICMGLLCPFATKIRQNFSCSQQLLTTVPAYLKNCDSHGQFEQNMLKL